MSKTKRKTTARTQGMGALVRPPTSWKVDLAFLVIIIALAFAVRYAGLNANGITSDEPIYVLYGSDYIEFLLHLDFSGQHWAKNMEHPPVSKYIYGAAAWLQNGNADHVLSAFGAAKLASLLMGVLTCALVYLIGREFLDRKAGFAAAVLLALLPTFVAHTQIAALEAPLALFATLTMYLYMLALKRESRNLFLASAGAFGLVLSTKYNGLLILPVLGLFYLTYRLDQIGKREGRLDLETVKANAAELVPVKSVLVFLGIGVVLFFALWPWLWSNPVADLQQSLGHWTYGIKEYFLGSWVQPPIYYYPVYFAVTLPVLLFLPLAAGVWGALASRSPFKVALLLWFLVPFAYGFSSFVQDGIRYIFVIYPAVALLCGLGVVKLAEWAGRAGSKVKEITAEKAFWAFTALAAIYLLVTLALAYPYYLDYYNELTGGPANVQEHRLFKTGWWGEGLKECMDYVTATGTPDDTVLMLTLPEDPGNTWYFIGDQNYIYPWYGDDPNAKNTAYRYSEKPYVWNMSGTYRPLTPTYVILNEKMIDDFNVTLADPKYKVVYQAKTEGAPLATVYKFTG